MENQTKFTVAELTAMNVKDLNKAGTALGIKNSKNHPKPELLKMCIRRVKKLLEEPEQIKQSQVFEELQPSKEKFLKQIPQEDNTGILDVTDLKTELITQEEFLVDEQELPVEETIFKSESRHIDSGVEVSRRVVKPLTNEKLEKVVKDITFRDQNPVLQISKEVSFASMVEKDGKEYYQYYPIKKVHEGKLLKVFRTKKEAGRGSICWAEDFEGNIVIAEGKSWDTVYLEAIKLRKQTLTDHKIVVYFDSTIPLPASYGKTY